MQEMVELSKMQMQQPETKPQTVTFMRPNTDPLEKVILLAGPAQFGPDLQNFDKISGKMIFTYPPTACTDLHNADKLAGKIAIVNRGNCMFIEKVYISLNARHFFQTNFLSRFYMYNFICIIFVCIILGSQNSKSRCACRNCIG